MFSLVFAAFVFVLLLVPVVLIIGSMEAAWQRYVKRLRDRM